MTVPSTVKTYSGRMSSCGSTGATLVSRHNYFIRLINSPAELAGEINSFFINKVRIPRQGIPATDADPLKVMKETFSDRQCSFKLNAVKPDEVLKVLKS